MLNCCFVKADVMKKVEGLYWVQVVKGELYTYEGWNFNSGNYLFTTDTK